MGAYNSYSSLVNIIISNGLTSIPSEAFRCCWALTSVTIPNSVTSIGSDTFYGSELTSITIPQSVTSIDSQAFNSRTTIETIVVEEGNAVYDSRNNCNAIIEKTTNKLILGCKNTIIPDSVTSIGDYAFLDIKNFNSDVRRMSIPSSVTSIGDYAFYGCELTSITIPSSVTSIGNNAFKPWLQWRPSISTIYVQNTAVESLLSGKYNTSKTTVVVDPSKF